MPILSIFYWVAHILLGFFWSIFYWSIRFLLFLFAIFYLVHSLPIVAITNHHVLKRTSFFLSYGSGGQKSRGGSHWVKRRCWQNCVPRGGSGGTSVSFPFPASRNCPYSLAHASFPAITSPGPLFPLSHLLSLSL